MKGALEVSMTFVDGKLAHIFVRYDKSVYWKSVDEFAAAVARSMGLTQQWRAPDDYTRERECPGFVIQASRFDYHKVWLTLYEPGQHNEAGRRVKQAEARDKETFRP